MIYTWFAGTLIASNYFWQLGWFCRLSMLIFASFESRIQWLIERVAKVTHVKLLVVLVEKLRLIKVMSLILCRP